MAGVKDYSTGVNAPEHGEIRKIKGVEYVKVRVQLQDNYPSGTMVRIPKEIGENCGVIFIQDTHEESGWFIFKNHRYYQDFWVPTGSAAEFRAQYYKYAEEKRW